MMKCGKYLPLNNNKSYGLKMDVNRWLLADLILIFAFQDGMLITTLNGYKLSL